MGSAKSRPKTVVMVDFHDFSCFFHVFSWLLTSFGPFSVAIWSWKLRLKLVIDWVWKFCYSRENIGNIFGREKNLSKNFSAKKNTEKKGDCAPVSLSPVGGLLELGPAAVPARPVPGIFC